MAHMILLFPSCLLSFISTFVSLQAEGRRFVREVTGASSSRLRSTANSTASAALGSSGTGVGGNNSNGNGNGSDGSDWESKLDQAIKAGLAASSPVLALFTKRIYKVR